jgi:hypothetical protein
MKTPKTPRSSFFQSEGRLLYALLWIMSFAAIVGLVWVWLGAQRANPVLLDLETGKPVATPAPHH